MRITTRKLSFIIQEVLKEYTSTQSEVEEIEEQDEIAGYTEPLGYGSPKQRKRRRQNALRANEEAFGGAE